MCRLYGFHATEATKVECTLVYAQNALLTQSWRDRAGRSHADGWGMAAYPDGAPFVERMALPAYHGEHFARAAARLFSRTVVAHVRAATVGAPALDNTHPFTAGRWTFAHNGTIPNFATLRDRFTASMLPAHRAAVRGSTDSEHIFRLLLSTHDAAPQRPLLSALRDLLRRVLAWNRGLDPSAKAGLNIVWTDGRVLLASRHGRPLWTLQRDGLRDCEICGFPHVHHHPGREYRAALIASEPLTHEPWEEVAENTLLLIDDAGHLHREALTPD